MLEIKCKVCGKLCKNGRGLSIHAGHMHKKDSATITELREEITSLRNLVTSVISEMRAGIVPTVPLTVPINTKNDNGSKPSVGLNYGVNHSALMDELKSVFKERMN